MLRSSLSPALIIAAALLRTSALPLPTPAQRQTSGAYCDNNAADLAMVIEEGRDRFESEMTAVSLRCVGFRSCVSHAFEKDPGYSPSCAKCFGDMGQCARDRCWTKCIFGRSPKCEKCSIEKCTGAFLACVGPESAEVMISDDVREQLGFGGDAMDGETESDVAEPLFTGGARPNSRARSAEAGESRDSELRRCLNRVRGCVASVLRRLGARRGEQLRQRGRPGHNRGFGHAGL